MYKIIGGGFNVVEKQPNNTQICMYMYIGAHTDTQTRVQACKRTYERTYTNTFTHYALLILTVDVHSIVIFACLFKCVYGKCFTNAFFI